MHTNTHTHIHTLACTRTLACTPIRMHTHSHSNTHKLIGSMCTYARGVTTQLGRTGLARPLGLTSNPPLVMLLAEANESARTTASSWSCSAFWVSATEGLWTTGLPLCDGFVRVELNYLPLHPLACDTGNLGRPAWPQRWPKFHSSPTPGKTSEQSMRRRGEHGAFSSANVTTPAWQ